MSLRRFRINEPQPNQPRPARYIVGTILVTIAVGSVLLSLPIATAPGRHTSSLTAVFTAASASSVTGLTVVDTARHWSTFGHVVIVGLVQVGGLGIMTMSSLAVVVLSRRLGLRQRLLVAAQANSLTLGDVRELVRRILQMTLIVEAITALVLTAQFWWVHHMSLDSAAGMGAFHAISAFNNAGFSMFDQSLQRFAHDPVVLTVLALAVTAGALGFPVWSQLIDHPREPRRWDLHTKLTLAMTAVITAGGWVAFMWFEWTNPKTMGPMSSLATIGNSLAHSVFGRTAGFATVDVAATNDTSHLATVMLMFVGGGSSSTAGGIKVSTFALLGLAIWAEVRGDRDTTIFHRRVPSNLQRQAVAVALLAVGAVMAATLAMLALTPFGLSEVLFESVSALATVGSSTGITPTLGAGAKILMIVLMFLGRVGPPTLFAALVLRERERLYRYPEERIVIG
ncbi:MAG: TrkH family potassium uptake protein [Microthrixaceae bacterium]|nr:TrkH family potassium uptake protein [Microthrixaceae bacterium]